MQKRCERGAGATGWSWPRIVLENDVVSSTLDEALALIVNLYICADVSLTSAERKKAIALFHAMDKSNDNKLSSSEYSGLMHQVYQETYKTHDYSLQTAIYSSVYYTVSDANKDHYIELNEFIAGMTKLKNRDPKDFPTFMKIAAQLKTLKSGQACSSSYFATGTCPRGTTCQRGKNGKYNCVKRKYWFMCCDVASIVCLDMGGTVVLF